MLKSKILLFNLLQKEIKMSNYKEIILNKLIDKFEISKSLIQSTNRRIILKANNIKEYNIEEYENKSIFHNEMKELKNEGIIDFSWKKNEEGNILNEIWLNKDNIKNAYEKINRIAIKSKSQELINILQNIKFEKQWLEDYRKDMLAYMNVTQKTNQLFPYEYAKEIVQVLKIIDKEEQILKRVLSIKCFNDSKFFERNIEHYIIRIIKKYLVVESLDENSNDDILLEVRNFQISRDN